MNLDGLTAAQHSAPLDGRMAAALDAQGLRVAVVPDDDLLAAGAWHQAVARGFHDGERTEAQRDGWFAHSTSRRKLAVYDPSGPMPDHPIATFASWVGELTVPGGTLPAMAISAVTVAATHRRRGILSALMTGELATAQAVGIPIASLTVSESSIYGRFGFAPAAFVTDARIDTRRVQWTGPVPGGRLDFIPRERAVEVIAQLHDRARRSLPGEISLPQGHPERFAGVRADASDGEKIRVVQYTSPAGEIEGVVAFSLAPSHDEMYSTLKLGLLVAGSDDAYAALWHFVLHYDLVHTVEAGQLSVDEPLWWMIADRRAAKVELWEHHYLRILDVPAALSARRYESAGSLCVEVRDPQGFAGGRFVLEVDADGRGQVESAGDAPASVSLGVAELSAALLGGVSLSTLARAGRVQGPLVDEAAVTLRTATPPRLSYWY